MCAELAEVLRAMTAETFGLYFDTVLLAAGSCILYSELSRIVTVCFEPIKIKYIKDYNPKLWNFYI